MVEELPDEGVSVPRQGSICSRIVEDHVGELEELLMEQNESGSEAWRLFLQIGDGFKPTRINYGEATEVDDDDVVDEVMDLTVPGVESASSVHTHPRGRFLSPTDVEMHIETVRDVDEYEATLATTSRTGFIELFGVEGGEDLTEREVSMLSERLDVYWDEMNEAESYHELFQSARDMFKEMDNHLDFCRERVDKT